MFALDFRAIISYENKSGRMGFFLWDLPILKKHLGIINVKIGAIQLPNKKKKCCKIKMFLTKHLETIKINSSSYICFKINSVNKITM